MDIFEYEYTPPLPLLVYLHGRTEFLRAMLRYMHTRKCHKKPGRRNLSALRHPTPRLNLKNPIIHLAQ